MPLQSAMTGKIRAKVQFQWDTKHKTIIPDGLNRNNRSGNPPPTAEELCEEFMRYFASEGQVPRQRDCN